MVSLRRASPWCVRLHHEGGQEIAGRECPCENSPDRAASDYDEVPVGTTGLVDRIVPGQPCPAGQFERDRARRRSDLQNAARRNALEGCRKQDLEATAELEVLGVDPMGRLRLVADHDSSALLSHSSPQRRVPLAISRMPASDSLKVHRRAQVRIAVVHRQQRP